MEQIGLVRHFKDDLEKLQKTFSMVNAFLSDAQKKQVTDDAVKQWLRELEDLAFDADNVINEIKYRLLSKKVGATKNKTLKKKLKSIFSGYRLKLGKDIKEINDKLKSINQQANEFVLQNIAAQAPVYATSSIVRRQTDSFSKDPIFLGREEDMSSIVDTLITAEQKLVVLPIVGMGGQGKTTLARKVFNHEQIKSHFGDNRVWVHVPRIFDDIVLLKRILTSMKPESNVEHGNREALLKTLQKELGAKKYLLLLDDVWNEDREKWCDFERSLLGISSANENCMIVTTRSEQVNWNISMSYGDIFHICNPFSPPPVYEYQPRDCPANSKKIGDIPRVLKQLACPDSIGGGILIPENYYNTIEAYCYSIQTLLDAYPGMEYLIINRHYDD
ncbi:hypothetical protein CASFOL_012418 [Castilleja foliolosa]|uniref:Uncharacterized protein n=1 Tax=Castilleja foliolosa TaxID=1961234 RepID=A0ABD3DH82_9LAMI